MNIYHISQAVCHNWSNGTSIRVLKKCHEALPETGKVIVVELLMPEVIGTTAENKIVASLDNPMFLHDGRERTEKEFESLCKLSGFSGFKLACRVFSVVGVIEFYKWWEKTIRAKNDFSLLNLWKMMGGKTCRMWGKIDLFCIL